MLDHIRRCNLLAHDEWAPSTLGAPGTNRRRLSMRVRFIPFALILAAVVLAAGRVALDPIRAQVASGHQLPGMAADDTSSLLESGPPFVVTDRVGRQVRPDVAGHPELTDCQNLVVW